MLPRTPFLALVRAAVAFAALYGLIVAQAIAAGRDPAPSGRAFVLCHPGGGGPGLPDPLGGPDCCTLGCPPIAALAMSPERSGAGHVRESVPIRRAVPTADPIRSARAVRARARGPPA